MAPPQHPPAPNHSEKLENTPPPSQPSGPKNSTSLSTSPNSPSLPPTTDLENQEASPPKSQNDKVSTFKGLGWLDRFLALWIFLAMAIGIILGNFVPNTGPALQKGKFVGVSVPIGTCFALSLFPSTNQVLLASFDFPKV